MAVRAQGVCTLRQGGDALHVPDQAPCLHHDGVICAADALGDLRRGRERMHFGT